MESGKKKNCGIKATTTKKEQTHKSCSFREIKRNP